MVAPRRTLRAFWAGTRQQNLYPFEYEELMSLSMADACQMASQLATRSRQISPGFQLATFVVLSLPVAVAMALAWCVLIPAWLFSRAFTRVRQV
jgi:hypothetical protein